MRDEDLGLQSHAKINAKMKGLKQLVKKNNEKLSQLEFVILQMNDSINKLTESINDQQMAKPLSIRRKSKTIQVNRTVR